MATTTCAADYATAPHALADAHRDVAADVLYAVGGLYGNAQALATLQIALRTEAAAVARAGGTLATCFNGDFHFFDAAPAAFAAVQAGVLGGGLAAAHSSSAISDMTMLERGLLILGGCLPSASSWTRYLK